jgi:hypothetical protein
MDRKTGKVSIKTVYATTPKPWAVSGGGNGGTGPTATATAATCASSASRATPEAAGRAGPGDAG